MLVSKVNLLTGPLEKYNKQSMLILLATRSASDWAVQKKKKTWIPGEGGFLNKCNVRRLEEKQNEIGLYRHDPRQLQIMNLLRDLSYVPKKESSAKGQVSVHYEAQR